jgi:hypothetical protein
MVLVKNLIFFISFFGCASLFPQSDSSIILSEIMFTPQSGNNEFIELYNSGANSIDLNNFKIKYHTSAPDIIIEAGSGTNLPPNSFAVIFEGDYDFESGIYTGIIPVEALVLKISDNAFGSSGMANTTDRQIWLLNSANDTLSTYFYTADNSAGRSDEKRVMNDDNSLENWGNSILTNGTPGFRNSISPPENDIGVSSLINLPVNPSHGNDVTINAVIKNFGSNISNNFIVEIFNDANFDSIGTLEERIYFQQFSTLLPGDSIFISTIIDSIPEGNYNIIAQIIFDEDENNLNDQKIITFFVSPEPGIFNSVVINEIMYAPIGGEPEWVELYNTSNKSVNLFGWRFADASTGIVLNNIILGANEFLILTADESIHTFYDIPSRVIEVNLPSLNNSGDNLSLRDFHLNLIDTVSYIPSWGGLNGSSLERISASGSGLDSPNWGTSESIHGATPGYINSITPKEYDLKITAFSSENIFGIIGESITVTAMIKNIGLQNAESFSLEFYNDLNFDSIPQPGELINEIFASPLISNDSASYSFSFNGFRAGNNLLLALIDFPPDDETSNNIDFYSFYGVSINEMRNDLIINEIMYAPLTGQPEWFEIFNRSEKIIDLKNYQIADNNDTVRFSDASLLLNPKEYLIVANDSSIQNVFNVPSKMLIKNFPALNNSGDKIILIDSLDRTIDSLEYSSAWGGLSGRSLEKIDPHSASIDSANWKTTLSRNNGTPGFINSVTQKDFDIVAADILFDPPFPFFGEEVLILVKIKNPGKNPANFSFLLYEDTNLDSIPDRLLETLTNLNLNAGDSAIINTGVKILLQGLKGFFVEAVFEADEDTSTNKFYKTIFPGFPTSTIVINEIMYAPAGGEPEWIELFNNHDEVINLYGWSVEDVLTTPVSAKINIDLFIPAKSYLVLTRDSTIFNYHRFIPSEIFRINLPNLNNDADGVVLKDNRGKTIDSVLYNKEWGGQSGLSLERISGSAPSIIQNNWKSSLDIEGSTPGRINSITPKFFDLILTGISFDPQYPVEGDDISVSALIKNLGTTAASNFGIEFCIDSDGDDEIDQLLSSIPIAQLNQEDSITINAPDKILNINRKILTAVRIVYAEDEDSLNNYAERIIQPGYAERSIAINEVMYNPDAGQPEWIEILNISNDILNLKDWSVSDVLTNPTKNFITNNDLFLEPGEFMVISADSSFLNFYHDFSSKFSAVNFGTLGNSSDGIVIYDFRDAVIDSLFYRSSWGSRRGFSLERISPAASSNDSVNWTTSLSRSKSTPGKENSLVSIPVYLKNQIIINEIMYDPDTDNSEFVEFQNVSGGEVNIGGWRIEDENGNFFRLSDTSFVLPADHYFVLAADSSAILKYALHDFAYQTIIGASSLGLINSGELILLKDVKGNIIDSVWYSDKWHNKNFTSTKNLSLERINPQYNGNDPLNWSSSVNPAGATPGNLNSIYTQNISGSTEIFVHPNPFSPDNDGFEDFAIINFKLTQPVAQVRIKIFDSTGRLVRILTGNQPSGSEGSIIFDGKDDGGNSLRIGIYIIYLEAFNNNSGITESLKTVVVIARKL